MLISAHQSEVGLLKLIEHLQAVRLEFFRKLLVERHLECLVDESDSKRAAWATRAAASGLAVRDSWAAGADGLSGLRSDLEFLGFVPREED